jgi:hypothetical protein
MLFGQWSGRKSLRDLVFSVNRQVRECYHLGLAPVKHATLADANQQRPARGKPAPTPRRIKPVGATTGTGYKLHLTMDQGRGLAAAYGFDFGQNLRVASV